MGNLTQTNNNGDPCDIYYNILLNPQFVSASTGNCNLQANSPCIDAGDPANPLDPDNTICDMGSFYFSQGAIQDVTVTLTPYGAPITIPAGGGNIEFNIEITNESTSPVIFDFWTDATLPSGSTYGPILNMGNLTLNGSASADRDRIQYVPGSAPSGSYYYNAYVGIYPNIVWDEDNFTFYKACDGDGGAYVQDWYSWGENFNDLVGLNIETPLDYKVLTVNPNPFNPTASIKLNLQNSGDVSLKVYDVQGRMVAEIIDGFYPAGSYNLTFDGSRLTSGAYFALLNADGETEVAKMLLLK